MDTVHPFVIIVSAEFSGASQEASRLSRMSYSTAEVDGNIALGEAHVMPAPLTAALKSASELKVTALALPLNAPFWKEMLSSPSVKSWMWSTPDPTSKRKVSLPAPPIRMSLPAPPLR